LSDIFSETIQDIYRYIPVMMHSIDIEGRIITVSNYWLEQLGACPRIDRQHIFSIKFEISPNLARSVNRKSAETQRQLDVKIFRK